MITAPEPRLNDRIRASEVRVIGPGGEQLGVLATTEALRQAQTYDLDLVEVAPTAEPPVCKIMDYGKFRYEQDIRAKEARRKQHNVTVKEMRFKPKISKHDFDTKRNHIARFLGQGSKVKVMVWFKGREITHPDIGEELLKKLSNDLAEVANIEVPPKLDGRNMIMVLSPVKKPVLKPLKEKGMAPDGGTDAEDEEPAGSREAVP